MVKGKYVEGNGDLSRIEAIRAEVFGQELKLPSLGHLEPQDTYAVHAIAFYEDEIVAVGRITFDGERFDISHIAVKKAYRNQEYGDFILKMLINKAVLANAEEIYAKTLPQQAGFFETVGFQKLGTEECVDGITYENLCLGADKIHCCSGCQEH